MVRCHAGPGAEGEVVGEQRCGYVIVRSVTGSRCMWLYSWSGFVRLMELKSAARLGSLPRIIAKRELKRQASGPGMVWMRGFAGVVVGYEGVVEMGRRWR